MKSLLQKETGIYYFNASEPHAAYAFSKKLSSLIEQYRDSNQDLVVLCIGTDRATGDSLGPLIGYKLSRFHSNKLYIYGTLEEPVHAKNLLETLGRINQEHPNAFIIAIDASLGSTEHIGYITLGAGAVKPGAGVSKNLPPVGDLAVTGIVNLAGLFDHMLLQTTRLQIVMKLADCISLGIRYISCL